MVNIKKKVQIIFSITLLVTLTTGCWDQLEIEDVGIVIGAGLDAIEKEQVEPLYHPIEKHPLMITHQLIISSPDGGKSEQQSPQQSYLNLTSKGYTLYKLARDEQTLWSDRPPYGQLIKVIVIGEEAARKYDLRKLLNMFQRDQSVLESVVVLIAEGEAKKIFEVKPRLEKTSTFYLKKLTANQRKSPMIPPVTKLFQVAQSFENKQSFLMQRVKIVEKDHLRLTGGSVIHGLSGKMIAKLDDQEVMGISFITGAAKTGVLEVEEPRNRDLFGYEFINVTSRIIPKMRDGQIHFSVYIDTEGRVGDDWLDSHENLFVEKNLGMLEDATNREIKKLAEQTVENIQKELKTDILSFGKKFQIAYPEEWKNIEKNWDEHFTKAKVEITVDTHLHEFGTKGKKQVSK